MNGALPVPHAAVVLEKSLLPSIRALRAKRKRQKCHAVRKEVCSHQGSQRKMRSKGFSTERGLPTGRRVHGHMITEQRSEAM